MERCQSDDYPPEGIATLEWVAWLVFIATLEWVALLVQVTLSILPLSDDSEFRVR